MIKLIVHDNKDIFKSLDLNDNLEKKNISIGSFGDGEIFCEINEDIEDKANISNIIFIKNITFPINSALMETAISLDAITRKYPFSNITLFIPYLPYARHDRSCGTMHHVSTKLIANILQCSSKNLKQIISIDVHSKQNEGCFDIPLYNLDPLPYIIQKTPPLSHNTIIVSPDAGAVSRARSFIKCYRKIHKNDDKLLGYGIIDKIRYSPGKSAVMNISEIISDSPNKTSASIQESDCIIIDDMVDGGSTLINAAKFLKESGANSVRAIITHGILSGNKTDKFSSTALERIEQSPQLDQIILSDSVYREPQFFNGTSKFNQIEIIASITENIVKNNFN